MLDGGCKPLINIREVKGALRSFGDLFFLCPKQTKSPLFVFTTESTE